MWAGLPTPQPLRTIKPRDLRGGAVTFTLTREDAAKFRSDVTDNSAGSVEPDRVMEETEELTFYPAWDKPLSLAFGAWKEESGKLLKAALIEGKLPLYVQAARPGAFEQSGSTPMRIRDKTAMALAKGDNSFNLGKARFLEFWLLDREIEARVPKLIEKYNVELPPRKYADSIASGWVWPAYRDPDSSDLVPLELKVLLEDPESDEVQQRALDVAAKVLKHEERDDHEALKEALPDLKRLDRYERRVWSAQKRAIREFMNIKLLRRLEKNCH
jgi:hypothetical protein